MACGYCRRMKKKCVPVIGEDSCAYCLIKGCECVQHISEQGKRNDLKNSARRCCTGEGTPFVGSIFNDSSSDARPSLCEDCDSAPSSYDISDCDDDLQVESDCDEDDDDDDDDDSSWCSSSSEAEDEDHHGVPILGSGIIYGTSHDQLRSSHVNIDTYSTGKRWVHTFSPNGNIVSMLARRRIKLNKDGLFTLMTNTSLSNMQHGCNGKLIMFRQKKSSVWRFGIVASLHYDFDNATTADGHINLFEWSGPMSSDYKCPTFLLSHAWLDDADKHFVPRTKLKLSVLQAEFINIVRNHPLSTFPVIDETRNVTDGGVQCLTDGPCCCPFTVPFIENPSISHKLNQLMPSDELLMRNLLFRKRGNNKRGKKRKRKKRAGGRQQNDGSSDSTVTQKGFSLLNKLAAEYNSNNGDFGSTNFSELAELNNCTEESAIEMVKTTAECKLAAAWNKPPNKIIDSGQLGLVVVSSSTKDDATSISISEKSLFFVPTIETPSENNIVSFKGVDSKVYKTLLEKIQGMDIAEARMLLEESTSPSSTTHDLLDCTTIQPEHESSEYKGYIRVFSGKASPYLDSADDEVHTISIPQSSTTIKYSFVKVNLFQEMVPLSTGCLDRFYNRVPILPSFLKILNKAVGSSRGLYSSPRNRCDNNGSLTFVGPKATKNQSQPSPSEGPKEKGYWFYRSKMNHLFWPFVLHLMMYLASHISLMSYYHYFYFARLQPVEADDPKNIYFCSFGIVTVNYNCALHVDAGDVVDSLDKSFRRKLNILTQSTLLNEGQKDRAQSALDHITHWGTGAPTTCGYQIIGEEDNVEDEDGDIEIIQYFCCRGLGICYRIRSFWVHMFLAYCFSHYTSVAIFISASGKVWFGIHPRISIFAWGLGKTK